VRGIQRSVESEQLERLLDGAEETDTLEFKGPMAWDRKSLVKDILAMANVIDGGLIIVGVEDVTYRRLGLSDAEVDTFDIEVMRDQIAPFADPRVTFRCGIVADARGLRYAVIEVSPFDDLPVICRRDGADVEAGTIYFRTRRGRARSARVDSSSDMRDIIERAAVSSARRLARIGFVASEAHPIDDAFDSELDGL
jgi:predicted HTH transcriptional regulator